ncbi:MAG: HD domain-containing phosphohydrolase [Myxococcota bacterium]
MASQMPLITQEAPTTRTGTAVARAADKPHILVVDDEPVICDILREFLEYEGFRVHTAGNGEVASDLLTQHAFDLVLTDLKMPGIGGLDLLRRIAELECDIETVIMTGFGTVETAIEAMKHGAFDYVLKPFKPEEVVRVLRRALDRQHLVRENFVLRKTVDLYELSEALSSSMPLDEQLRMIAEMVRESLGADGISILLEDPHKPGTFVERLLDGRAGFRLRDARIAAAHGKHETVLLHGASLEDIIVNPESPDGQVASFMSTPLRIRGDAFGMLNAFSLRREHLFTEGQRKGLAVFGGRAAQAIDTARMYARLQETFTQTIEGFARAIEAKDNYTHGHSDRVAMYARLIARAMGLPAPEVDRLQHGGLMHDIGKIGIRSHDLNKAQKLTPAEYVMFKSHPVLGRRIIEPIAFLVHLVPCVYHHHESFDGTGYPDGLGGGDIPLEARILAVADSYDAMTSDRPYRKALPHDIAIVELRRCSGRQFDPRIVEVFLGAIEGFRRERRTQGVPVPE